MTGGDIVLIAAGVFAILVALLALPIIRLTKVFDELIVTIRSLNQSTYSHRRGDPYCGDHQ